MNASDPYKEAIKSALDDLLSNDNEVRNQASDFLLSEIDDNPMLFETIFTIYSESEKHRRLCLILIKFIVKNNYLAVQQNFAEYLELTTDLIQPSAGKYTLEQLADIIYYISYNYFNNSPENEKWEEYPEFLVLYRESEDLLPFCFYLYNSSMHEKNFYLAYKKNLDEIISEIILCGLQYNDPGIILSSIHLFSITSKKEGSDFFEAYQDHHGLICQIAENSLEMDENEFNRFWGYLYSADTQISSELFDIACAILPAEELPPNSANILLSFIITRIGYLQNPDDLEYIISCFFQNQYEIEEVESDTTIYFSNFKKMDNEGQILKMLMEQFYELLVSEDKKLQYVGLRLLPSFFEVYQEASTGYITEILPITLETGLQSEENVKNELLFLELYLNNDTFNLDDSLKTIDFIVNIISECTDVNIQYRALNICKKMPSNPLFFKKMLDIHDKIQPESLAVYFSILIYFYRVEFNINMDDFEGFLTSLIKIFNESSKNVSELSELYDAEEEAEILDKLYANTLICGSSGNLILFLRFFSPIQLDEYVNQTIESFFNILRDDYDLRDVDHDSYFSLRDVKEDFVKIILYMKESAYPIISHYEEDINEGQDIEKLQHYFCYISDVNNNNKCAKTFYDELYEETERILKKIDKDKDSISSTFEGLAFPMSKWIHKLPDDKNNHQIHKMFLGFINGLINPKITFERYNHISKILLRLVKPKRIEFNQQNEWYTNLDVNFSYLMTQKMVKIIEVIDTVELSRYFNGFTDLVLTFAHLKKDDGLVFLNDFVIPFYTENQDSTEIQMLNLFTKMIELEYFTEEELKIMVDIINGIIEREKIYHDIEIPLFELISTLSKINPEIASSYLDFAIQTFNENKENLEQIDLTACCAYFLLLTFNQNPEEYSEIIMPIISDILSVFPITRKKKTEPFWVEMKSFIEICKDSMTKEIIESLISCITRYLSYQNFTNIIFSVPDNEHDEIIQYFAEIIRNYASEFSETTLEDILIRLLPHQPTSIQFILSLYFEK